MRILHAITDKNIGGAGVLLKNLILGLEGGEFSCEVLLPKDSRLLPFLASRGVRCIGFDMREKSFSPIDIPGFAKRIRTCSPDILHTHGSVSARIAALFCGGDIITVNTRHCAWEESDLKRYSAFQRFLYSKITDMTVFTANAARDNFISIGIRDIPHRVILNGAEQVREAEDGEIETFISEVGMRREDFKVGMCGRLSPEKGHATLIRAIKKLATEGVDIKAIIAGDGDEADFLRRYAHDLGIEKNIYFTGYMSDTAPFYRSIQLHINASSGTETSSLAISEAMSAGVPTVASDFGGNRELICNGENGFLFRVGDADMLADTIYRIYSSEKLFSCLRSGARLLYERKFSSAGMCDDYRDMYRSLISNKASFHEE